MAMGVRDVALGSGMGVFDLYRGVCDGKHPPTDQVRLSSPPLRDLSLSLPHSGARSHRQRQTRKLTACLARQGHVSQVRAAIQEHLRDAPVTPGPAAARLGGPWRIG